MKKLFTFSAYLLIIIMLVTCVPCATAASVVRGTVSGSYTNPLFEHIDFPLSGTVNAPVYYGDFNPADYSDDESNMASAIRENLEARTVSFSVNYIVDYEFSGTEDEIGNQAREVASKLFDLALVETDSPTEGDSLRYCYYKWDLGGSYAVYKNKTYFTVVYGMYYFTTAQQEAQLSAAVDTLVQSFGFGASATERQKADVIYEYITENITYDYTNLEDDDYYLKFSAYAALINKTAVCEGYAVLFYRLAEECGLDARVITGVGGTGANSNHAWNIVKLGSTYYYLDSTWDAGVTNYDYYLKGDNDFGLHTNDPQFDTAQFRAEYPIAAYGIDVQDGSGVSGNFSYYVAGGNATITAYNGNETNITVPSTVGGYPVKTVASEVFAYNDTVQTLTFSEGITALGIGCIIGCDNLKELHLPSTINIESYGRSSFTSAPEDCYALETLTVANGNTNIKLVGGVLYSADMKTLLYCPPCNGITELTVPSGVVDIGNSALANHETLEKLVLPATVKNIGFWAFTTSTELSDFTCPAGVEFIGQYAFSYTGLKSFNVPASLTEIMYAAFAFCYFDTITVDAANTVYRVENGMLRDNTDILKFALSTDVDSVIIPDGIQTVQSYAFDKAVNLKNITLPSTLEEIGQSAFYECTSLNHIDIPDGVTKIGHSVFGACDNLVSITVTDSVTDIADSLFHPNYTVTIYGIVGSAMNEFAIDEGHIFKPISDFVCKDGHNLQKTMVDDAYFYDIYNYTCTVCGCKTKDYTISYKNISEVTGEIEFATAYYTGESIVPDVLWVKDGDKLLTEGVDYKVQAVEPDGNITVGMAVVCIEGIGDYVGIKPFNFEIKPAPIEGAVVTVYDDGLTYNNKPACPDVKVTLNGKELVLYNDYSVEYKNNNAAGTAQVVITGNYCYEGSVTVNFTIGAHQHTPRGWEYHSDTQHKRGCQYCNDYEYENHKFDNNCDEFCNVCFAMRGAPHTFGTEYSYDGNTHWIKCNDCAVIKNEGGHYGGNATCNALASCAVCGARYGSFADHRPGPAATTESAQYCLVCGDELAPRLEPMPMQNPFSDVAEKNYFYTPVLWAVTNGVTAGVSPTSFGPSEACTRAQVVTFLWRAAGSPEPTKTSSPFVDISSTSYYYKAVLWAVESKITAGVDATHFAPASTCTRGQIVSFLYRFAGNPTVNGSDPFTDVYGGEYYYKAVLWAVKNNITAGVDATHFAPASTCTRAQVVSFLYRYMG